MNAENATKLFNDAFDDIIGQLTANADDDKHESELLEEFWALLTGPLGPYADDKPACLRTLRKALET